MSAEATTDEQLATEMLPRKGRVLAGVRELLGRRDVSAGDPLPSERSLASQFGVDRKTVRRALEQLENEGLIAEGGGRRRRVVSQRDLPFLGILRKTIILLSDAEIGLEGLHVSRGWDSHIYLLAMEHFHSQGLSVLAVQPARFLETTGEAIASLKPAGVMMFYGIVATRKGREVLAVCRAAAIPIVIYGGADDKADTDRITSDHGAGAYQLTKWLLGQGRRRILPFWRFPESPDWLVQREAGYQRAMREAGLEPMPALRTPDLPWFSWTQNDKSRKNLDDLARVLLGFLFEPFRSSSAPDAIMVATDPHAFHVNAALRLLGKEQGEVLVVGYDNTWRDIIEREWEPIGPAATIDKQNEHIGRAMSQLLLDRIAGKLPPLPQVRHVEPALVICGEQAF